MEYIQTTTLLCEEVNTSDYNKVAIAYVVNGTVNINGVYYYIGANINTNNKVKLKLYSNGTGKIINDKSKNE